MIRQKLGVRAVVALAVLASALVFAAPSPAGGQMAEPDPGQNPSTLFLVDTSGSMRGTKLTQAKEALRTTVTGLAGSYDLGLREFSGSCANPGQLLIPVGPVDEASFLATVDGLRADGGTPTSAALRLAAQEVPAGGTIVLIADGDDSCGDLCVTAQEIIAAGVTLTIQTVGVQVSPSIAAEMECAATATGGEYFDVTDPEDLTDALGGATSACGANPVLCYAPELRFHPNEDYFPMDADDFVNGSELRWAADVGCGDFTITENPTPRGLTNGAYASYESDGSFRLAWDFRCGPQDEGRLYESTLFTRPFKDQATNGTERPLKRPGESSERLEDTEGFYLAWVGNDIFEALEGARGATPVPDTVDGRGFEIDAPVYFEQTPTSIVYWFFYGHDPKADHGIGNPEVIALVDNFTAHEGDWERIQVNLVNGQPDTVLYFGHGCPATVVAWDDVEKVDGTHPVVYSAEGAHASYPGIRNAGSPLCNDLEGRADQTRYNIDDSAVWRTWTGTGPAQLNQQCWYGFGGAWGRTDGLPGLRTHATGPVGPPFNTTVVADGPEADCRSFFGSLIDDAVNNTVDNILEWLQSRSFRSEGGVPGTEFDVSLLSVPVLLHHGVIAPDGTSNFDIQIPIGTAPGAHRIIIQESATGEVVYSIPIWVDAPAECVVEQNAPGLDIDGDHVADRCDPIPDDGARADLDGDGVANGIDNCPTVANPDQVTTGVGRSVGEACDVRVGANPISTYLSPAWLDGPFCGWFIPTIIGTDGDDAITGTNRDDVIWAGPGDDLVDGRSGDDIICGADGNDTLRGGPGADQLFGDADNDILDGGPGGDELFGGDGDDTLLGANSPDTLYPGDGTDIVDGGRSPDTVITDDPVDDEGAGDHKPPECTSRGRSQNCK